MNEYFDNKQIQVYVFLLFIAIFALINLAYYRKRNKNKKKFPSMINAFYADYHAENPLSIGYFLKINEAKIFILPAFPTDFTSTIDEFEKVKKFKIDKPSDYLIKVVIYGKEAQDDLLPKIEDKLKIEKLETKFNKSVEIYINRTFSQMNLYQMTKLLVPFREHLNDDFQYNQNS